MPGAAGPTPERGREGYIIHTHTHTYIYIYRLTCPEQPAPHLSGGKAVAL